MAEKFIGAKASPSYADSWTYLTQASNGYALGLNATGYIARSAKNLCFVGLFCRPLTGQLAVHLLNPLGAKASEMVTSICHKIRAVSDCAIFVKKADPEVVGELEASGRFSWNDDCDWHRSAPLEDDTFPELLLDVNKSLELFEAGRLSQARDKFARFLNRTRQCEVLWAPLVPKRYEDARSVVKKFFAYKEEDHIDISQPCDYENMLIHPIRARKSGAFVRQLCCIDGKACALLVMERIAQSNTIGLYCNLALYQEHKYLSEYVVHQALRVAQDGGYKYINVGGSESEGLHQFKRKFQPVDEVSRKWLVFNT